MKEKKLSESDIDQLRAIVAQGNPTSTVPTEILAALIENNARAEEWLTALVPNCARAVAKMREYDMESDEIHYAHQSFVGLLHAGIFALTGVKNIHRVRVMAERAITTGKFERL